MGKKRRKSTGERIKKLQRLFSFHLPMAITVADGNGRALLLPSPSILPSPFWPSFSLSLEISSPLVRSLHLFLPVWRTRNGGAYKMHTLQTTAVGQTDYILVFGLGCLSAAFGLESSSFTLPFLCAPAIFWTCGRGKTEFQYSGSSLQEL